jgi:rhodanese-related sulfurtransferase
VVIILRIMIESPVPIDIEPQEFLAARRAGQPLVLVDCREPWEYEIVHLPDSVLIPLGQLSSRASEVPGTGSVVVYCHHGVRSRRGAAILRHAGLSNARSLAGGIDEWSISIDPSLPRY